jgi:hypothetical protein
MANEEKLSRAILTGMADSRLNTAHLAWLTKMDANGMADKHLKEFFYFYQTFRNQDADANDVAWLGEKIMNELRNPEYETLTSQPPPGTRIVFADEM